MKVVPTNVNDVLIVESKVFDDDRGFFTEVFHHGNFAALNLPTNFVQDNHSRSHNNVLRGLHFQREQPQGKLVRVVRGTIFDVAVDLRRSSSTFGKWCGVSLEAGDGRQLWIPPGFAHGFLVLSHEADVSYKCTTVYHHASHCSLLWNDPVIGIEWPISPGVAPLLSGNDADATPFSSIHTFP
ncbi:MAG: dTDP-4-dehydrorhamnose 3,5-epimerase [Gemmatimonadaceae bacterium]